MVQTKFMTINDCKIEMKKYQDPKLARKTNIITTLSEKIILLGVVEGVTESLVTKAIKKGDNRIQIDNIILKKCHKNGELTGEAKIVFKGKNDINKMRAVLPLNLGRCGRSSDVILDEQ
jgi:hypothetical protein